jgi:serpin B
MLKVRNARLAAVASFVLVAAVAAGCSSSGATPVPSKPAGPPASTQPSAVPSSGADTPAPTLAPGQLPMALGKAAHAAPAPDHGQAAAAELNDFGFDLLRKLDANGNLVASPASIALALGMVRPGAKGQTAAEMDKVLHGFGGDGSASEISALLSTYAAQTQYFDANGVPIPLDQRGKVQPAIELDVADEAFVQKDLNLEVAYLDALRSGFNAGIALVDYKGATEAARLLINSWASTQTKGRIPNILGKGDIDSMTRLVLVNAIYLKAAWDSPFDPSKTTNKTFTTADGASKQVPTMAITNDFQYGAGAGYKSITLPYTMNGMSMTIVVPDDMAAFTAGLSAKSFASIVAAEQKAEVDFTMPKFSLETRVSLSQTLAAMGMPTAFDAGAADFTGMTKDMPPLYIGNVIHQANIDVVEEGTTAAAVTAVVMTAEAMPQEPQKVTLHVDKPFLYFIQDSASNSLLFMGRVNDPTAK